MLLLLCAPRHCSHAAEPCCCSLLQSGPGLAELTSPGFVSRSAAFAAVAYYILAYATQLLPVQAAAGLVVTALVSSSSRRWCSARTDNPTCITQDPVVSFSCHMAWEHLVGLVIRDMLHLSCAGFFQLGFSATAAVAAVNQGFMPLTAHQSPCSSCTSVL